MGFCRRHSSRSDCTECTQVNIGFCRRHTPRKGSIYRTISSNGSSSCSSSSISISRNNNFTGKIGGVIFYMGVLSLHEGVILLQLEVGPFSMVWDHIST